MKQGRNLERNQILKEIGFDLYIKTHIDRDNAKSTSFRKKKSSCPLTGVDFFKENA